MPRDFWNPKEVAGMRSDRSAARANIRKKAKKKEAGHKKISTPKDSFFRSMAWKQLRYLALRNSGGCNCCGAKAKDGVLLHVDHIKPRAEFPELALSLDNLQVLCEDCNVGKGSWDQTDWR